MADPVNAARINEACAGGVADVMAYFTKYAMNERIDEQTQPASSETRTIKPTVAVARTVMITGQQEECTQERFDKFYKPAIEAAAAEGCHFVIGAAEKGCDAMAHDLLQALGVKDVVVYDKQDKAGRGTEAKGWRVINGFKTYPERDDEMVHTADCLIVYLFENAVSSGTWRNVMTATMLSIFEDKPKRENSYWFVHTTPEVLLQAARACIRDAPLADDTWKIRNGDAWENIFFTPRESS